MSLTYAIICAAGYGQRFSPAENKLLKVIAGLPIIAHTLQNFIHCELIDEIILAAPEDQLQTFCSTIEHYNFKVKKIIAGGTTRQQTVYKSLCAIKENSPQIVVIHDAARPIIEPKFILKAIESAKQYQAAILALPLTDTLKLSDEQDFVTSTVARKSLWLTQTPQAFQFELILRAHQEALKDNITDATDDACLVERLGTPVKIIEGSHKNIKVTYPEDLELVEAILLKNYDQSRYRLRYP